MSAIHEATYTLPNFDAASPPLVEAPIKSAVHLVDFNAEHNPHHLFCLQIEKRPEDTETLASLQISHSLFRDMVCRCQSWIIEHVDGARPVVRDKYAAKQQAVAILLESDVGLIVHLFAFMGLGIPVLLLSTRLSPRAIHSLLSETQSGAVIASPRLGGTAKEALTRFAPNTGCPTLYEPCSYRQFVESSQEHVPEKVASNSHYVSDTDRNVLILHSSGTSRLPKAIPQSHRYLLSYAPYNSFEFDSSWSLQNEQRMAFSTLPLYHCYGLLSPMISLSIGKPFAIPHPGWTPSAISTVQLLEATRASTLYAVPSVLEDIAELPGNIGGLALQRLDCVVNGGAALSDIAGKILVSSGVRLVNGFGSTEVGSLGVLRPPRPDSDWRYFRLRKDRECYIQQIETSSPEGEQHYHIRVRPPGWMEDCTLGDIFTTSAKHPGQDFRSVGRVDDVIVLANGKKVQPCYLESTLVARADVEGALVFGEGRRHLGVLVEPAVMVPQEELNAFRHDLWQVILEAEKIMEAPVSLWSEDAVLVLQPGQTFPRSAKGSILRQLSYERFSDEIEYVYLLLSPLDISTSTANVDFNMAKISLLDDQACLEVPVIAGPDVIQDVPKDWEDEISDEIANHIWRKHDPEPTPADDLFELGMDSQQAAQLRHFVVSRVNLHGMTLDISNDFVYAHPSVSKMVAYLQRHGNTAGVTTDDNFRNFMHQHVSTISSLRLGSSGAIILLTGGTGALGCHLLARIASTISVAQVICLNRPHAVEEPRAHQFANSERKGAPVAQAITEKIQVFNWDGTLPYLGLSESTYWRIASTVTHIVHNAWPVDFRRKVESFGTQFTAMSNLLQLSLRCRSPHRFLFVSSVAVVSKYQPDSVKPSISVPEQTFQPTWTLPSIGYARAKLVCESMLEKATKECGVDGIVVRCGQISSARSNGYWNPSEHVPKLMTNSIRVGALPNLDGTLSWLPLEDAAAIISELLLSSRPSFPKHQTVYHVENSSRRPWKSALGVLSNTFHLPLTPFKEWLDRVRQLEKDDTMIDFFEAEFLRVGCGRLSLDTQVARQFSQSLCRTSPVEDDTLRSMVTVQAMVNT